jgi:hypothetical protein
MFVGDFLDTAASAIALIRLPATTISVDPVNACIWLPDAGRASRARVDFGSWRWRSLSELAHGVTISPSSAAGGVAAVDR